jgi:hypothetical protein
MVVNEHTDCGNPVWNAASIIAYRFEAWEISRYFTKTNAEIE